MPKKPAPKKKTAGSKPKQKAKGGLFGFLSKLFLFSLAASIFFVGADLTLKNYNKQTLCANSKSCVSDLAPKIENGSQGFFQGRTVVPPQIDPEEKIEPVLGVSTPTGDKHIYVDLSKQTLYAYQGKDLILKTLVSTGKWGKTPVGNFNVWEKLRATRMAGGEGADAYDLPNVPYVMYFFHDFGLHGAYWHDNFGHTMSHGCVNMRQIDAQALFEWTDGPANGKLGTPVSVCNQITGDNKCVQDNPVT